MGNQLAAALAAAGFRDSNPAALPEHFDTLGAKVSIHRRPDGLIVVQGNLAQVRGYQLSREWDSDWELPISDDYFPHSGRAVLVYKSAPVVGYGHD